MGIFSSDSTKYFKRWDIIDFLRNIPSLTVPEREMVKAELMKEFQPDYRLSVAELVQVVLRLSQSYKISWNDREAIFQKFGITQDQIRRYR